MIAAGVDQVIVGVVLFVVNVTVMVAEAVFPVRLGHAVTALEATV